MEWISPDKFLFTYPHFLGVVINQRWTEYEKIWEIFMARKNKPLQVLEQKGNKRRFHSLSPEELLCFYCEFGLNSLKFLVSGDCLLGKDGFVEFCSDFRPGYGFGRNPEDGQNSRKSRAREILEWRLFRNCHDCQHLNDDNVAKISKELDPKASEHIWDNTNGNFINFYPQKKACELGRKLFDRTVPCKLFRVTEEKCRKRSYQRRCRMARIYFARLEKKAKQTVRRTSNNKHRSSPRLQDSLTS